MAVFGFKDAGFEIKTDTLGTLNFHRVTPDYATRIERADAQHDLPPDAFLSLLIVILGSKQDGRPILVEDAYALSASEREIFVHAFLNEHGEYYRERVVEERTSDLGEKVTRSFLGDRIVNPRRAVEEPAAYLTRLYRDFASGAVSPEVRRVEPLHAAAEERNDAFTESLLKNAALSESLGKSLAQMKMLENRDSDPSLVVAPAEPVSPPDAAPPPDTVAPAAVAPVSGAAAGEPAGSSEPPPLPPPPPAPPEPPPEAALSLDIFRSSQSDFSQGLGNLALRMEQLPSTQTPEPDSKQALEMMRSLQSVLLQNLEQLAENAEQNAQAARKARRLAVLALILALLVPAGIAGYLGWTFGPAIRDLNKAFADRSAQAVAEQKQQADSLKSLADQVRALRTQPPPRLAD